MRPISETPIETIRKRGKRAAMDSVFHMHHLAHAHNQLVSGNLVAGLDAKAMAKANKGEAG